MFSSFGGVCQSSWINLVKDLVSICHVSTPTCHSTRLLTFECITGTFAHLKKQFAQMKGNFDIIMTYYLQQHAFALSPVSRFLWLVLICLNVSTDSYLSNRSKVYQWCPHGLQQDVRVANRRWAAFNWALQPAQLEKSRNGNSLVKCCLLQFTPHRSC